MNIGKNIKTIRKKSNITQKELADGVFVSQAMICKIEVGIKVPTLTLGKAIADFLGCSLDDLVK